MSRLQKSFIFSAGFFYLLTTVFTLLDNRVGIEFCAPVATFLVFLILMSQLKHLDPHKFSTACMGVGFLCIDLFYIFRFVTHYIGNYDTYKDFVGLIYILPSAFFFLNETSFLIFKLKSKRRDLAHLFSNTFAVAIVGSVIIMKLYRRNVGEIQTVRQMYYLVLIFIAFYVAMTSLQTFHLVGRENMFKGTLLTTSSMLIYEILDIQYIYIVASGGFPDDYYIDLIYMALMILMTAGIVIQVQKKYYFEFKGWDYGEHATRFRFVVALLTTIGALICVRIGFLDKVEAAQIVIVAMAYVIMSYMSRADNLGDELLEHEKRQNVILEEKVKEQTASLTEVNKKLELLSSTDMLTGLYNRWYAGKYMDELQEKTGMSGKRYAFFAIDLNNFKPVNDTYGHEMGDRILEEFGYRMRELPDEYTCFRMGGDEFLVIYRMHNDAPFPDSAAEDLRKLFNSPVYCGSYVFQLSASIGISLYPHDSSSIEELLQYADAAMYYVKKSGNKDNYKFFNKRLIEIISTTSSIERRLKTAKPEKDFVLFYQPHVSTKTKQIEGAEVYVHLSGDLEDISPVEIIKAAEESGYITKLGVWVINTAIRQIDAWNKKYGKALSLTINMSPLQLVNTQFEKTLKNVTKELDFLPSMITLDVSNAVIMGAAKSSKDAMTALHEEGYLLSLNDFGGGDINLSFVMDCGFNGIKLSRSLVTESVTEARAKMLVKSIIAVAENFGITVTAVGVETKEQSDNMESFGVDELQGYYYGKPVKAEEFEKLIK